MNNKFKELKINLYIKKKKKDFKRRRIKIKNARIRERYENIKEIRKKKKKKRVILYENKKIKNKR